LIHCRHRSVKPDDDDRNQLPSALKYSTIIHAIFEIASRRVAR